MSDERGEEGKQWIKQVIWQGNTQTHDFDVEFYKDFESEHFVAKIRTNSLILSTPYGGSKPKDHHYEELRDNDLDQLYESTKQQIESRYRRIINVTKIEV